MPTAYRKQAMKLSALSDKDIILKPIQPNLGVEAAYRKSLKKLLREMRADVQGLLERHYPKGIAQDSLTDGLQAALSALLRYWLARLDKLAPQMAEIFANQSANHTERAFQTALRVWTWRKPANPFSGCLLAAIRSRYACIHQVFVVAVVKRYQQCAAAGEPWSDIRVLAGGFRHFGAERGFDLL